MPQPHVAEAQTAGTSSSPSAAFWFQAPLHLLDFLLLSGGCYRLFFWVWGVSGFLVMGFSCGIAFRV